MTWFGGRPAAESARRAAEGLERVHVEYPNLAASGLDALQGAHGLQRPPERLDRGAGRARELVLGERQGDADRTVLVPLAETLRELEQPARDSLDRREGRELDPLGVGVTQAAAEHLQERERRGRMRGQEGAELTSAQAQRLDALHGHDRGRARFLVDGGLLADQLAGAAEGEYHLAARRRRRRHLHPALPQQQDAVGDLALQQESAPANIGPDDSQACQGGRRLRREGAPEILARRSRGAAGKE